MKGNLITAPRRELITLADPQRGIIRPGVERVAELAMTPSDISALLLPGLQTAFFETFNNTAAVSHYREIATIISSNKDTEQYAWLGALPGMREFVDERQPGDLPEYTYAIKNKTWESTVAVDRAAIEDDQYSQLAMRVRNMGQTARYHLDAITFGLLTTGATSLCYDGQPFFGNHTQGGAQSNKGTEALSAQGLQDAITAMMRFVDDKGRPMGIVPDTLVVPPELAWEAWTLLNSAFFPDAVTGAQNLGANPLRGRLRVVESPYLSNTANWFLLDTKRVVKAIVLQMRKEFEFDALEGQTESGFLRDQYLYGVRARYNVGFGDWRAAYMGQAG